ncbi:MAG: H/ACA ribonucleoprotein complex subunit GAR1 [Salinarchaeum sp.]
MKRLGTVSRIAQGLAVCRQADPPQIGTTVLDQHLQTLGTVVDVFGPVDQPYVAVSPAADVSLAALLGEKLYVDT